MPDQLIPERIQSLLDLYNSDECTDQQRLLIEEELETLDLKFENLLEHLKIDVIEAEADLEHWKAWLKAKSEKTNARIERLDKYIVRLLQRRGMDKIKTGLFTMSLRESKYVEVVDEALLPKAYVRSKTTYEPNKLLLNKDLKEGKQVSGAELKTRINLITK